MFKLILGIGSQFGFLQGFMLIAFFVFFVGIIIWAIFANKQYINHMRDLPFESQNSTKGEC